MDMEASVPGVAARRMRQTVRLAAILNIAYFGVEFAVPLAIGSVSLFADSIDFWKILRSIF
jgi:Co/Zn/Cd efflux system component